MASITILISLYKSDKFISGFLDRLSKQTILNECQPVFIINEGRGTLTQKEVEEFECENKKIINVGYEGLYESWNRGINNSNSEYICNMNCDDYHYFNALEIMKKGLDDNPEFSLCRGRCDSINIAIDNFNEMTGKSPFFLEKNDRHCGPFPMWRRNIQDKVGLFSVQYLAAGDHEMWLRMLKNGAKFLYTETPTCIYYDRAGTLSVRVDSNGETAKILKEYAEHKRFF